MKFILQKKLNNFCLQSELLSIWLSKTASTISVNNTNIDSLSKKNVFLLDSPDHQNTTNNKETDDNFFIKFPGIYEFSGVIINVYALHHDKLIKNVPQINLSKDFDITYIAYPEFLDTTRHKNLLENIEETKILILNCKNDTEKNTKLTKNLVDAIEPQLVIPYSDSDTKLDLNIYITKLFGTNPFKTDRLIIKPNLTNELKDKFILIE